MANSIKVLFWLHRSKLNNKNQAPLILRLSFQSKRIDKSTGYYVSPKNWNIEKQRIKGEDDLDMEFNAWMDNVRVNVKNHERKKNESDTIHLPSLMETLFIKTKEEKTLLQFIAEFNRRIEALLNKDYTYSTYEKYVFTEQKIKSFIETVLNKQDILLKDLTTKFIMGFDHFLRTSENNQHNTAVKYCLNLKHIINTAVIEELLQINPFKNYRTVYKQTPQVYLEEYELKKIQHARLVKPNHLLVRELFVFQCLTGLAYADMMTLKPTDFTIDTSQRTWIIKSRQKTGVVSTIPLLPQAKDIIQRHSRSEKKNSSIFTGYSIQKYNQYLSEIADLIALQKKLSSHVGRRTFGNIALGRGVSLNVVSKILGHSNTIVTQKIYAITTQEIIGRELVKWQ